jgi:hypothetical protein
MQLHWQCSPWFAWRPVPLEDGGWAWLKRVERRELGFWAALQYWCVQEVRYALLP